MGVTGQSLALRAHPTAPAREQSQSWALGTALGMWDQFGRAHGRAGQGREEQETHFDAA